MITIPRANLLITGRKLTLLLLQGFVSLNGPNKHRKNIRYMQNLYVRRAVECIVTFSLAVSALYKINLYLKSMKPFSFIQFPNAKALKLKVKSRRIFKMSLLCNKGFDRASVVFCRPVKLHDRSCETSFLGNVGCFDFDHRVSMQTVVIKNVFPHFGHTNWRDG